MEYTAKLSAQVGVLEKGRDSFILLLVEQQCEVLYELLKIFKCNAELGNLKMIGGAANAGKLTSSKKIVSMKNLKIINQSLTGLFEEVIEVDKL
ncbi:MAG: hypothetical protein GX660_27205 [Clostridiaceae bacterium]|nr:hypothetical protein [Clostridiaceae bacterium]